jgi:propanol-preferring alcohol dehydrogenase
MKSMQLLKPKLIESNPLTMVNLPIPEPGSGQVRLKIRVCGACHTDLHTVEGEIHPPSLPVTPGHQVVGIVDRLGLDVNHIKLGDRVGIPWFYDACGICDFCRSGLENLCPDARFTGFHVDGGYAEYMVAEAKNVLPIPAEISDEQAAPLLCAGIIGYRSLRQADVLPGECVGLFGFGASAHLTIQVAHHWECKVFVFTRSQEHRKHAQELGATWIGGAEDTPPKYLDRAIIYAPSGRIVHNALEKLRPGGTLAINAIHMSPIPEMPYHLIYGERTMRSVANATYQDGIDLLRLAVEIPIRASVEIYDLEDANQALLDIKHSRINGEAILRVYHHEMV